METITKQTRAEAWLAAAKSLHDQKKRIYNLILEVESPGAATKRSLGIEKRVDSFLRAHGAHPLNTVAETIFPATEYKLHGIQGVYDYPRSVFPSIKAASPWGNYALRLTQRHTSVGHDAIVPLQLLIDKAKRQLATKSPKYAAYEMDIGLEAMEIPFYDPEMDHWRVIGGQCLSHISVKLGPRPEYAIYLTATYRYQYYGQKALGNLLGLARLQACIARELERPIGPLVCHATLAVLEDRSIEDVPWTRKQLDDLIDDCSNTAEAQAA